MVALILIDQEIKKLLLSTNVFTADTRLCLILQRHSNLQLIQVFMIFKNYNIKIVLLIVFSSQTP